VQVRAEFEPAIPVIATVPAIKPAALTRTPIAVWATARTTGSAYQHDLIAQFAPDLPVAEVACPGLADAVESGDLERVRERVKDAAARTPASVGAVVLGCTQYELAVHSIAEILGPSISLHYSGEAVARQVLRRVAGRPSPDRLPARVTVLESGRVAALPPRALVYSDGKRVARHAAESVPAS
jgi:glutamate racemase